MKMLNQSETEFGIGSDGRNESALDSSDILSNPDSHYHSWIISPTPLILLLICIFANGTLFIFVFVSKTYRSPANYLLANLCLASTIYIANMIMWTLEKQYKFWTYGPWACVTFGVLHKFPLPLMTLTIMSLSLDRSRIARNPLSHPSKSSVLLKILSVWVVSFVLMIPRAMISSYDPHSHTEYKCKKRTLLNSQVAQACYACMNLGVIHLLPAYILIKEWMKTRKQMKYLATCQIEQGKSFARRLRLMRNACIFTCIFVTCWLPMGIIQFPIDWISPRHSTSETLIIVRNFFRNAVLVQACINPILLHILSFDLQELLTSCIV